MDVQFYYQHKNDIKSEEFFSSGQEAFIAAKEQAVVAHASSDGRFLQYWFFYPKNGCQGLHLTYRSKGVFTPPTEAEQDQVIALCNLAIHEGDWEHLSIRLTEDLKSISEVYFSQHNGGIWLPVESVELSHDRPITYAALNSHANYPHSQGFASIVSVGNAVLDTLTGLSRVEVGDIVWAATGAKKQNLPPWYWDTRHSLILWNYEKHPDYSLFAGVWGLKADAVSVKPVNSLPSWLATLTQVVGGLAGNVLPQLQGQPPGKPPISPWARSEWENFNWIGALSDIHSTPDSFR